MLIERTALRKLGHRMVSHARKWGMNHTALFSQGSRTSKMASDLTRKTKPIQVLNKGTLIHGKYKQGDLQCRGRDFQFQPEPDSFYENWRKLGNYQNRYKKIIQSTYFRFLVKVMAQGKCNHIRSTWQQIIMEQVKKISIPRFIAVHTMSQAINHDSGVMYKEKQYSMMHKVLMRSMTMCNLYVQMQFAKVTDTTEEI